MKFEWISNFPLKLGTFYPIKFQQWKQINQCISDFENYILNAFPTFMNCVLVFFKVRNLFIFITTLITKKRNTFMNCLLVVFKVRHLFNFITTLITKKSNNSVDCFHVLFKVRPLYDFITTVITNKINISMNSFNVPFQPQPLFTILPVDIITEIVSYIHIDGLYVMRAEIGNNNKAYNIYVYYKYSGNYIVVLFKILKKYTSFNPTDPYHASSSSESEISPELFSKLFLVLLWSNVNLNEFLFLDT